MYGTPLNLTTQFTLDHSFVPARLRQKPDLLRSNRNRRQRQQADWATTHPFLLPLLPLALSPSCALSISILREKRAAIYKGPIRVGEKYKGISGNWRWQRAACQTGPGFKVQPHPPPPSPSPVCLTLPRPAPPYAHRGSEGGLVGGRERS